MAIKGAAGTDVESALRHFIATDLLYKDDLPIGNDDSFIDNGVVDSTSILELMLFVEETFHIAVRDEEVVPENFDSISRLARYVRSRLD